MRIQKRARSPYLWYTFAFLVTSCLVFCYFALYKRSFVWDCDGLYQHYNCLMYYGRYLREILKNIFIDHNFVLPMWDMQIGYGSDIVTTLSYYVLGDPLTLLSVFVPASATEYLYGFLVILRYYLIGAAFLAYCRYHKHDSFASVLGALAYAFCGFALFAAPRHPYFANPMIYLPLYLMAIDKLFDKRKPLPFILMTALCASSNFYFFYMMCILIFIYAVFRYVAIFGRVELKPLFTWLFRFIRYFLLGLGMSMVLLLPSLAVLLSAGRMGVKHALPLLYEASFYKGLLSDFFGFDYTFASSQHYIIFGFVPIVLIGIITLFFQKKKYLDLKLGTCLMLFMVAVPYCGHVMNGFSYAAGRWGWGYAMLFCYILVKMYPHFFELTGRQYAGIFGVIVFYSGLCLLFPESRDTHGIIGIACTLIIFLFLFLYGKGHLSAKLLNCVFAVSVIGGIGINAFFLFSPSGADYIGTFRKTGYPYNALTSSSHNYLVTTLEDDSLFRYDQRGNSAHENTAMQNRLYGTDYYFSLSNPLICRNIRSLRIANITEWMYDGLDARTILDRLAGVKYFVVPKDKTQFLPYSYNKLVASDKKYAVYSTDDYLPFGYTYDSYIPADTYEELTAVQKQSALLQGVVLNTEEDPAPALPETDCTFTDIRLEPEVVTGEHISYDAASKTFTVDKSKSSVTLTFAPQKDCEVYLLIDDLSYTGTPTKFNLKVSMDESNNKITVYTSRNNFYSGNDQYLSNLGYFSDCSGSITLTFPSKGTYQMSDLYVICQPVAGISDDIDRLKQNTPEDLTFSTNKITASIQTDTSKVLVLAVPYSKGWKATINGQSVPLLQANTMYMGLELSPGESQIELTYETPLLKVGALISLISFLIFIIRMIQSKRKTSAFVRGRVKNDEY